MLTVLLGDISISAMQRPTNRPTFHWSPQKSENASKDLITLFENAKTNYNKSTLYSKVEKALAEGADPNASKEIPNRRIGRGAHEYIPSDFTEIIPLHSAIELQDPELVKLLVLSGADPKKIYENYQGARSALDIAKRYNNEEINSILRGDSTQKLR